MNFRVALNTCPAAYLITLGAGAELYVGERERFSSYEAMF